MSDEPSDYAQRLREEYPSPGPMPDDYIPGGRTCCPTYSLSDHYVQCPKWEPPLTVEELRVLRHTILKGVESQ